LRRAREDEVRHAGLCAELSAAYGKPATGGDTASGEIAPGSLGPREAVLYEMVAACCITETESVATLTTLMTEDAEPRVREILHEIARDEVVHSRMGWAHLAREAARIDVSFLSSWIPAMLSGTVSDELFAAAEDEPAADELLRHGVLPRAPGWQRGKSVERAIRGPRRRGARAELPAVVIERPRLPQDHAADSRPAGNRRRERGRSCADSG